MTESAEIGSLPSALATQSRRRDWCVAALVCAWKLLLLLFTAQPIPTGDSFFYDGPVVNYLTRGNYCNPSLALVLPISGNEVFSAYPPLHQGILWMWMSVFGTSVVSSMWMHFGLFVVYVLALLAIFRRLNLLPDLVNFGSLFLISITFHDRPDSLAFACGFWSIYAWLRAAGSPGKLAGNRWSWLAAGLAILTMSASLHIGMFIILWGALLIAILERGQLTRLPWLPLAAIALIPIALVIMVKAGDPRWWAGFLEHVRETPTLGGWRLPHAKAVLAGNFFKNLRTVPGLLFVGLLAPHLCRRMGKNWRELLGSERGAVMASGLFIGALLIGSSLLLLMQSLVFWAGYLQPLLVALFLAAVAASNLTVAWRKFYARSLVVIVAVTAARAVGMTTWGAACAADVSEAKAVRIVEAALEKCPSGSTVTMSSPYLYGAVSHRGLRTLHMDWLVSHRRESDLVAQIIALKPAVIVLTQFDYYRPYASLLNSLKDRPELLAMQITNTAGIRPPDSFPPLQKFVQHVSWAPVIVELSWK